MMLTTDRTGDTFILRSQSKGIGRAAPRIARTYGIADIWQLVWRYKRFLVSVVGAGTLLSLIITFSMTEIYTATSAIVFDRNDTRLYEALVEAQKQERDKSAMETELDVIRSRVFTGIVVDALKLTENPYYNTYLPEPEGKSESWIRSRLSSLFKLLKGGSDRQTPKDRVISEAAQRDRAITTLLSTFTADRKGDSLAMSIKVDQANPVQAAAIANAIAQHYIEWTSNRKEVATKDTVKYLRRQADELASSIADKEREIAAFTAKSDLTFDPKDDLLRARLLQLNEQYTLARVDEGSAWAKVNEVREKLNSQGQDSIGKVVASELLTNLRTEEARLMQLKAQLTSKFGKNHPLVVDADAELASNRRMISDEAARILQELETSANIASIRVKGFEQEVELLQERIRSRNLAEIRRRELERDLLTEQKRYDSVQLRLSTLNPAEEEVKPTAVIASFAEVPVKPSFPQPAFILAAGMVGSAMLAVVLLIIADALDDRIHRPEVAEQLLNRPNLTSIPDYRAGAGASVDPYRVLLRNPEAPYSKLIRNLCLAWRTIDDSAGGKVVMFTSANSGDGKTMLSLSMAAMAKMNGLRTMVVDLNPSENGAARISGVTPTEGALDKFLNGKGELGDVISVSPHYPFLDMVASRLAMQDYERLFSALRDEYDLVIVDTPALEEADDAIWLSSHVDSILPVVAANKTKQRVLSEAIQRFNLDHALLIGSVTNFYGKPSA